jgi:hypothetical protein
MVTLQIVVMMEMRMMTSAVVALETDRIEVSIGPVELVDPEGLLHVVLGLLSEEEMEEMEEGETAAVAEAAAVMGIMG